jgi:hypothetical protein
MPVVEVETPGKTAVGKSRRAAQKFEAQRNRLRGTRHALSRSF